MVHHARLLASAALLFLWCGPGSIHAEDVPLQNATATLSQTSGWDVGTAIDGVTNNFAGWAVYNFALNQAGAETAVFETVRDVGYSGGSLLTFQLFQVNHNPQHTLGRFRLSYTVGDRNTFADGLNNGGDVTADWLVLSPLTAEATGGAILSPQADGSILADGPNPVNSVYTISAMTAAEGITGFRLEVMEDPSLPFFGPGRYPANGNFVLSELQVAIVPVPEPSVLGLLASTGIGLLGWSLHRAFAGRRLNRAIHGAGEMANEASTPVR